MTITVDGEEKTVAANACVSLKDGVFGSDWPLEAVMGGEGVENQKVSAADHYQWDGAEATVVTAEAVEEACKEQTEQTEG